MIKEHFTLLERAVDTGLAKDIDIHYNTNTTQYPDPINMAPFNMYK